MIFDGKEYRDKTPEEIEEHERQENQQAAEARHAPMTTEELDTIIRQQTIQHLPLTPQQMVRAGKGGFYPDWDGSRKWEVGESCWDGGKVWRRRQPCNPPEAWRPGSPGTESLWECIPEEYTGDKYDPVPYTPPMRLEDGKYYTEAGVLYICTRPSGNPATHPLTALVGHYVDKVPAE